MFRGFKDALGKHAGDKNVPRVIKTHLSRLFRTLKTGMSCLGQKLAYN
jgi:hypothetical protein